jgi:hypothetical protein
MATDIPPDMQYWTANAIVMDWLQEDGRDGRVKRSKCFISKVDSLNKIGHSISNGSEATWITRTFRKEIFHKR